MSEIIKCKKCKWWLCCDTEITEESTGQCKRLPPFPDGITYDAAFKERWDGAWPNTVADDYCGEAEAKEKE